MKIPANILNLTGAASFDIDTIGKSNSSVLLFDDKVLKICPITQEAAAEVQLMQWLDGKLPAPKVLTCEECDTQSYLLMSRVCGDMACAPRYMEQPGLLVKLLADAMKQLWRVDIADCPVDASLDIKLAQAEDRVKNHLVDVDDAEPGTFGESGFQDPEHLLFWLKENRPIEEPVLSHGDFCLPNIFFEGNALSGFIDLGRMGIGDKWCDIAICYRSLCHNFSGKYDGKTYPGFHPDMFFEALGIEPDWEKIRYYILLDELF